MLLFEDFIAKENISLDVQLLDIVKQFLSNKLSSSTIPNANLDKLLTDFIAYKQLALAGELGKTPQYYTMYINFIDYYLMFTRSIRLGDFELYKEAISKMVGLFFIFNQVNYARWLSKYLDNLLKV